MCPCMCAPARRHPLASHKQEGGTGSQYEGKDDKERAYHITSGGKPSSRCSLQHVDNDVDVLSQNKPLSRNPIQVRTRFRVFTLLGILAQGWH
jgi:hypothetical protein